MNVTGSSGKMADVNSGGQLMTTATAEAMSANLRGDCYCALGDVTSATTDDDFFYLKNNDARDLVIFKIQGWCDDAEQEISIYLGGTDAGTDAGDAVIPINLNAGHIGGVANVDCTTDATDLAITGGSVADLLKFHNTALSLGSWDYPAGLILPTGTRMHAQAALAGLINFNVFFYFRAKD